MAFLATKKNEHSGTYSTEKSSIVCFRSMRLGAEERVARGEPHAPRVHTAKRAFTEEYRLQYHCTSSSYHVGTFSLAALKVLTKISWTTLENRRL